MVLVVFIYLCLWYLTIIGGIIKYYSYFLVEYIVAENSNIKTKDAINLYRRMINGHKWEYFKLQFSFILWKILGIFKFQLSNIFFLNPYTIATFNEYYAKLRQEAIDNKIEGYELLNDHYLFDKAHKKELNKEYKPILDELNKGKYKVIKKKGVRGFLENNFGICIKNDDQEQVFEKEEARSIEVKAIKLNGDTYPIRLSPCIKKKKIKPVEAVNYMRRYSIVNLIMIFFVFSFIGWLWEVTLHLVADGTFVNRGTLHGPWLPIYGFGELLILVVLYHFRKNPIKLTALTLVLCGVIEYFTSWYLEIIHNGQKWWDYSGYFLNLNGRICAEGLIVFALGGLAVVYLLDPSLDGLLKKNNYKILTIICTVLLVIYTSDIIYSKNNPNTGEGITSYKASRNYSEIV